MHDLRLICAIVAAVGCTFCIFLLATRGGDSQALQEVPFVCQAPLGDWANPCQQNGCEEACLIMASKWLQGAKEIDKKKAVEELVALCNYEKERLGFFEDTSISDTAILWRNFFKRDCEVIENPSEKTLCDILAKGRVIAVPINGTKGLRSPYYRLANLERHMVLLIGYNRKDKVFIVNDPGTKNGSQNEFGQKRFLGAIQDYSSGGKRVLVF